MTINNNGIYNAALAGASGGVQEERAISDSSASAYADIQAQIVTFAAAIDTAIATDATLQQPAFDLMQSICQAVTARRFLTGQTSGNLSVLANAVAAFWTELKGQLQPASAGIISALANVQFVQSLFTGTSNGSISSPQKTIQAAASAIASPGIIFIAPGGTYNESVAFNGKKLTIVGMQSEQLGDILGNPSFSTNQDLTLINLAVGSVNTSGVLTCNNCSFSGSIGGITPPSHIYLSAENQSQPISGGIASAGDIVLHNITSGSILQVFTAAGSIYASGDDTLINPVEMHGLISGGDCQFENVILNSDLASIGGNITCTNCRLFRVNIENNITLTECNVTGGIPDSSVTANAVFAENTTFASDITAATSVDLNNCSVAEVHTPGGNINFCTGTVLDTTGSVEVTASVFQSLANTGGGGAVVNWDAYSATKVLGTNIAATVVANLIAPRANITVNVPALAANAIGSVAVDMTGLFFQGIPANAMVAANAPAAGVAGGGFLANAFVSSANHITYVFHGPTAGGNAIFPTVRIA